jgi:hypothetical protein
VRHFPTGQTMPEAVQLYPKAWVPIADDATTGTRKSRSQRGGVNSGSIWVLWGQAAVGNECDA